MEDLISVIIPAYNAEKYLAEAIQSILTQNYYPLEVIVVDDDSTDGTAAIAQGFGDPVRYIFQSRSGAAQGRNRGVEIARGKLLAFLDADDLWLPGKLSRQSETLQSNPSLEAVFGHAQNFLETGDPAHPRKMLKILPGLVSGTLLIYKTALLRIGGFLSSLKTADAVEFYLRARESGLKDFLLPDILLYRRIHGKNQGTQHKDEQRANYVRLLKAALDRKRGKTQG